MAKDKKIVDMADGIGHLYLDGKLYKFEKYKVKGEEVSPKLRFVEVNEEESLVSRVIHGRRKLDSERKLIWAKALKCKPEDIFQEN